jgi:abortive infection bacteriophage resistance protein
VDQVKTHLPYDEQLALIVSRGMAYSDRRVAMLALKRIGYYKLSAYTYPFRAPIASAQDSAGRSRSDTFVPGSTLEDALKLYAFDEKLRMILLEGLNAVEVGLAVKIAYVLGKRAPMAHLEPAHLDLTRCDAEVSVSGTLMSAHDAWIGRYEKLKHDAIEEEYVKHHVNKYGGSVPIWAAIEFLDFGCLIRLFDLMRPEDTRKIANELGVAKHGAGTLFRWAKALNILRNHCAHSNRVWNLSSVDVPPKFSDDLVHDRLVHLNDLDNSKRQKLYYLAALVAYLAVEINPDSDWPRSFRTVARKLGDVHGITVENAMGFPPGWDDLPIWAYVPQHA